MRIAIFSDLHGNLPAIEAVIADIAKENVDLTVCAGDIGDPLPDSLRVWHLVKGLRIPVLRGNHEDYTISFNRGDDHSHWDKVNLRPIRLVAEQFGSEVAQEFEKLPLGIRIPGPSGTNVFVCHASPESNVNSFFDRIDVDMARQLDRTDSNVIVSGHRHAQWATEWNNKLLISIGSVGIPLNGSPQAEYLLLCFQKGAWTFQHKSVPYDFEAALRRYRESGWVSLGGPMAWLLYDEIQTGERRLSGFFNSLRASGTCPIEETDWAKAVETYLRHIRRWNHIISALD